MYIRVLNQSIELINVPIHCINTSENKLDIDIARKYNPSISESIISDVSHFFIWDAPEESIGLVQRGIDQIISNQVSPNRKTSILR